MELRHIEVSAELTVGNYNVKLVPFTRRHFTVLRTTNVNDAIAKIKQWYKDNGYEGNITLSNPKLIADANVCPSYAFDTWRTQRPREIRYETL